MTNLRFPPRARELDSRSGGPEHIAHIVGRVLDRIAAALDAQTGTTPPNDPPPPPAQRPAA